VHREMSSVPQDWADSGAVRRAARSLGQSMRILKREVQSLHEDEPASPDAQAQIEGLQAQINNLQQQTLAANGRGPGGHRADSLTRGPQEMG
jgi:hypothetical protein